MDSTSWRVLLVEDDPGDANLVRHALHDARDIHFELSWVSDFATARQQLRDYRPDIVLLDLSLPDSHGLATVYGAREAAGALPVIVLTGHDDTEFALRVLESGAQDYLVKGSFDSDGLVRAIRYAISRARLEARNQLLVAALEAVGNGVIITDTEASIEWVNPAFETLSGYTRTEALGHKPRELFYSGQQDPPFYAHMWHTIRAGETWRGELVNRHKDGHLYHEELVITPVREGGEIRHFVGIKMDISQRKKLEEELRILATTDTLTGLPNRRYFLTQLDDELARLKRFESQRAAVLMLDLDHFKRINDRFGHAFGDAMLCHFAHLMTSDLRKIDTAGRVGGEEFAILLPGADLTAARIFAERLRQKVANSPLQHDGQAIHVTVSIGLAAMDASEADSDAALIRADEALYRAKEGGRNRVEPQA